MDTFYLYDHHATPFDRQNSQFLDQRDCYLRAASGDSFERNDCNRLHWQPNLHLWLYSAAQWINWWRRTNRAYDLSFKYWSEQRRDKWRNRCEHFFRASLRKSQVSSCHSVCQIRYLWDYLSRIQIAFVQHIPCTLRLRSSRCPGFDHSRTIRSFQSWRH